MSRLVDLAAGFAALCFLMAMALALDPVRVPPGARLRA